MTINFKKEELKRKAEKFVEEHSHVVCYCIGVGVGMLAGGLIFGTAAAEKGYAKGVAQTIKDISTSADGMIDLLVDHNVDKGAILLQLTKHSMAGNIDVSSALTADTARSVAKALNDSADIIDASIKPVSM